MPTQAWIHVYSATPDDYAEARHAALYFHFPDNTGDLMHIVGHPGIFKFEVLDYYVPGQSKNLVSRIPVGMINDSFTPADIRRICAWTLLNNSPDEMFWDCHQWVYDVLTRLVKNGAVSAKQMNLAIDRMIYSCLEAEDEGMGLLRKKGGAETWKRAYVL